MKEEKFGLVLEAGCLKVYRYPEGVHVKVGENLVGIDHATANKLIVALGGIHVNDAVSAVRAETEFPGPMPDGIWERLSTREDAEQVFRSAVNLVKKNIASRIEAL